MADKYVNPAVGASGTGEGAGESWAKAYKTLAEATTAAAAGEAIYFANATADVITADTTYTLAAGVRVISTSDTTNSPPTTYAAGATLSTTTSNVDVIINGAGAFYGVNFSLGDGADTTTMAVGAVDGSELLFSSCSFTFGGTSTSSFFRTGSSVADISSRNSFVNCSWTWGNASQQFRLYGVANFIGCDFSAGATHPSALFFLDVQNSVGSFRGCDFSDIATVFSPSVDSTLTATLTQCILKTSFTSIYSPTASGQGEVFLFDCSTTDSHIELAHYGYFGSTVISTSIYANDHIADSPLSWVVSSSANASRGQPYKSPWIDVYHSGTSAITPYLECLRSGSTTAYKESELWSEWVAKATSGSTRSTFYSNELGPLATTGNNEASSKNASAWTGEAAEPTPGNWYGKLQPNASFTPAEAGHISVRVCLGVASATVYVDPQIRGLS